MKLKVLILITLAAAVTGCGKSQQGAEKAAPDHSLVPTAASDNPSPNPATATPPGTIEMPSGVDASAIPVAAPRDENDKSGGIEMPTGLSASDAPVIVKRPPLDSTAQAEVKLTAATLELIQQAVVETNKVCVVDFWSLACGPCLKEFPGLVRLQHELPNQVACISVNLDFTGRKSMPAEKYRVRAESFLQSSGATFSNFLCETPNEEVFKALKIVSIPAVLVFDAKGNLVKTFTDTGAGAGFTYATEIAPLVHTLVTQ